MEVGRADIVLGARIDDLERGLRRAERETESFSQRGRRSLASFAAGITAVTGASIGLAAGITAARQLASESIAAASQVESLKLRLANLLQSEAAAAREYQRFARIASTTPFELRNVVEAGVTLRSFGEANGGALKAVADLAAFMGTDVTEAAGAYGRAFAGGAGAADILRERGVLSLVSLRSGIDDLTKLSLPEFRRVLFSAMVDPTGPIAGATERLSQSWGGRLSNISDALFNLKAELGTVATESTALADVLLRTRDGIDETAAAVNEWIDTNRDLIDQDIEQWARGFESAISLALRAAKAGFPVISDTIGEVSAQLEALELYANGRIDISAITGAYLRNALPGGGRSNFRDFVNDFRASELQGFAEADPRAGRLLDAIGAANSGGAQRSAETAFGRIAGAFVPSGTDRQPTARGATNSGGARKASGPTAQQALADVSREYTGILDAQTRRLEQQAEALRRIGDETGGAVALEAQALELRKQSLEFQVAALESAGSFGAELAQAQTELEGVNLELDGLTGPFRQVTEEIERSTTAAQSFGRTLQSGVGETVKQIVVGIAQGTTDLKDFPERLLQASIGNFISGGFDALGGLFSPGTGAGLGGLIGGNAPPQGFTGPPVNRFGATTRGLTGALQTAGGVASSLGPEGLVNGALGLGALAGNLGADGVFGKRVKNNSGAFGLAVASAALAPFTLGLAPLAVALFGNKGPSANELRRQAAGDAFRESNVFPTLAFAKDPTSAFRDSTQPGFIDGLGGELGALSLILGGTLNDARFRFPTAIGRRAAVAGLGEDQVRSELRTVAGKSGVGIEDAVFDLTNRFLRFQQEGKGAAITQREYNDLIVGTVKLLSDDLPFGIDASASALDSLQQFGQQQIANLDDLTDALDRTAQAAQSFAAGVSGGIRSAIDSGDVLDVSRSLASAFVDEFTTQATDALLKSDALSATLGQGVSLINELATAASAGDLSRVGSLQAQIQQTLASATPTLVNSAAPIQQIANSLQSSLGVTANSGVINTRGYTSPLVIQNIVNDRVVSEAVVSAERLNRSGGVIVPAQIGTR